VVPSGWSVDEPECRVALAPHGRATVRFGVTAPAGPVRRARVAVDLTIGGVRFGQQAEALVTVQ
jgi:hypothetical protein